MTRSNKIVTLVLALLVMSIAFAGCGQREQAPSGDEAQTAEGAGSQAQGEGVGIDPGQTPPAFTLPDLGGDEMSLSDFAGDVIILDLWATWCPPCRKEIPFLVSLYEEHKDAGLSVVGVALDQGGASVVAPFVEANNVTYTILIGNAEISQLYKVSGIPMTLIIDRDGRVVSKEVGFAPTLEASMRATVEELLNRPASGA